MPNKLPNQPKQPKPTEEKKESALLRRLRTVRVNRAVFLSAIIILSALAVILVITAVTNRTRRRAAEEVLKPVTGDEINEPVQSDEPTVDPSPVPDEPKPDTPVPTVQTVPTLSMPVDGSLLQSHSADVQVFSRTMQDYRVHLGVDLATVENAPVLAAADGTVARIWDDPMMGKCIAISHAANALTVYKNLAADLPEDITVGAAVVRGQRIGQVGDSAMLEVAEEPHLHFEMTVGGIQVNPLEYFPTSVTASLAQDTSYEDAGDGK